jgi:hypothetical protein
MIRYALACDEGHGFESWFANSATYDNQVKRGLVSCPVCNSTKVEKAIMARGWRERKARRCVHARADARGAGVVATVGT